MPGESFSGSISSSPGFQGEAMPFNAAVSQKMSRPVHQGFTHDVSQPGTRSIYILAIRDMMEQGFHSFVSIEPRDNKSQQDFTAARQGAYSKGTQGASFGVRGREQNDFLASTPQYLQPQFQRSTQRAQPFPGQTARPYYPDPASQSVHNFSQTVMNEYGSVKKGAERGPDHGKPTGFSSDDAENVLLEHYRTTFSSSQDSYRSKFPREEKFRSSYNRESSVQKESGAPRGVYADAYRGIAQVRKREAPVAQERPDGTPSPGKDRQTVSKDSAPGPGNLTIKMEPPSKKPQSVLGTGESMIRMTVPDKKPSSQKNEVTTGKKEFTPESKSIPDRQVSSPEGKATFETAARPEMMKHDASRQGPQKTSGETAFSRGTGQNTGEELPQGRILGSGIKTPAAKGGQTPMFLREHKPAGDAPAQKMPGGVVDKPQPELLRTKGPEGKNEQEPPIQKSPGFSDMSPEQKVDELLARLEKQWPGGESKDAPVKGREQLHKPWETATSRAEEPSFPKQQMEGPPAETGLPSQRNTLLQKPMLPQESPQAHKESVPVESESRENAVVKLREELKMKLESPQSPVISQRQTQGDLGAKSGVIQSQDVVKSQDDSGSTRKVHNEELTRIAVEDSKYQDRSREKSALTGKVADRSAMEGLARQKADAPIDAIRALGDQGSGGAVLASALSQQEMRPVQTRGKFDLRQGEGALSHKVVDEVQRDQRNFGEQGEQGGFQDQGRGSGRSPYATSRQVIQNQQLNLQNQLNQQAVTKQEVTERNTRDSLRVSATVKQEPERQTQQAVKHASTCIESILKKSHQETWTGDEMAAKLIAILMKSASSFTYDHSSRVTDLSMALAKEIGIDDESRLRQIEEGAMFHDVGELELDLENAPPSVQARLSKYIGTADLKNCSFLHDIGKVKIPESILYKPGRLTDEEFAIIKKHPVIGEEIIKPIPSLQHALPVVRHHHEKWDGTGYPDGLAGDEIPLTARIVGIADAYDAMVSDRPYRKGMPIEEALAELKRGAGTQFDPKLVKAFLSVIEKEFGD